MKNVRPELYKGQLRRRVSGNRLLEVIFVDHGIWVNFDASVINNAILQVQSPVRFEIDEGEITIEQISPFDQAYIF
jgi:hypothetical protein